jgi:NAD(P)-dependent dehydrogenase (short-subunit alcohol dehydrogenase family)
MVSIGVYGATGYTGRFVAAQLVERGHHVVLGGRDAVRLQDVATALPGRCEVQAAHIDDAAALRRFARRCAVVINCAGPFGEYGRPVAVAAINAGAHYLDHTSQAAYLHRLMRELDGSARAAGVVVVGGMTFFTGLADLVVHRLATGRGPLRKVSVAYAVEGWRLTPGSRATAAAHAKTDRLVYRDGALQVLAPGAGVTVGEYAFPPPIGMQQVFTEYTATCESVTVPRHTRTDAVEVCLTTATLAGTGLVPGARSAPVLPDQDRLMRFTVVVDMQSCTDAYRGWMSGVGDIYEVGAMVSVQAAERLGAGEVSATGVLSPAEAFGASGLLDALFETHFIRGGLRVERHVANSH